MFCGQLQSVVRIFYDPLYNRAHPALGQTGRARYCLGFLFFDLSVSSKLQFITSKVVRLMVRLTLVSSNTTKKNKESIDNKFM